MTPADVTRATINEAIRDARAKGLKIRRIIVGVDGVAIDAEDRPAPPAASIRGRIDRAPDSR